MVRLVPVAQALVDARAQVELGPKVVVDFTGDRPPRVRRLEIRALYQTDFSQTASTAQMKRRTEETWKSLGHPYPVVEVTVTRGQDSHRVRVHSVAGERAKIKTVRLLGLDPAMARALEPTVSGSLLRMQLALKEPTAIDYLHQALVSAGLPEARVQSIEHLDHELRIAIAPGAQRRIVGIELKGFPDSHGPQVREALSVEVGDPAMAVAFSEAALTAQWALRGSGYPGASVRPIVKDSEEKVNGVILELAAEPGPYTTFGTVTLDHDGETRERWIRRMADIREGEPFDDRKVAETRRRLLQTRIFDNVRIQRRVDAHGRADLVLDLDEKPPYRLAYGVRWDHDAGFGGLFDARRLNAGGRGIGLGTRALWLPEQKSLRLYGQVPVCWVRIGISSFTVSASRPKKKASPADGTVVSAQLGVPLGRNIRGRLYTRYRAGELLDQGLGSLDEERFRSPELGAQWILDRRDQPTAPAGGTFLSVDLTKAWDFGRQHQPLHQDFAQAQHFRALPGSAGPGFGLNPCVLAQPKRRARSPARPVSSPVVNIPCVLPQSEASAPRRSSTTARTGPVAVRRFGP